MRTIRFVGASMLALVFLFPLAGFADTYGVTSYSNPYWNPYAASSQPFQPYQTYQPYVYPYPTSYEYPYQYVCQYPYAGSSCPSTPAFNYTPLPIISNISGPNTLARGQTGTWYVKVSSAGNVKVEVKTSWSDPGNTSVNVPPEQHVVYGDQVFALSHTYYSTGVYTILFTLTDQFGRKSTASSVVTVSEQNYPFYRNTSAGSYYPYPAYAPYPYPQYPYSY